MTRRWSLAAAFLLTVVCGFLIVSFGSSSGVFAWGGHGGSTGAVQTQSWSPVADVTITDASIPVDFGTGSPSSSDAPRRDDGEGEHRDDDDREDGEHEEGERD